MTDGRLSQLGVVVGDFARSEFAGFFLETLDTSDTAMSALGTNYTIGLDTIVNETSYLQSVKPYAETATTTTLPTCTYDNGVDGFGATLTKSSDGAWPTIDGYDAIVGDLILVKNQASAVENGLYVVTQLGSGAAPWILTRHPAFDSGDNIPGAIVVVRNRCSTNADSVWLCTAVPPVTVGSGNLQFDQLNGTRQITAGSGISKSGNTLSVANLATSHFATDVIDTDGTLAANSDTKLATQKAVKTFVESKIREQLTGDRTYYVNGSTGSDSNNGTGSGTAFLTLQKAVDVVAALDRVNYNVTVNVADVTYTTGLSITGWGPGRGAVTFVGNTGTPANVLISTTSANAITVSGFCKVAFNGFKLQTTTGGSGIAVSGGALVELSNVHFGACNDYQIYASTSSTIDVLTNYTIAGGATCHVNCELGSNVIAIFRTITVSGTPAFSFAFASVSNCSALRFASSTFSGSATGGRYNVSGNAIIDTGGLTLPGDSAGPGAASGGVYS